LPGKNTFVSSLIIGLEQAAPTAGTTPAETVMLASFDIPAELRGTTIEVLFWNPEANGGSGSWEALQDFVITEDGRVEALVNSGGIYVLAACDPVEGCGSQAVASVGVPEAGVVVDITPGEQVDLNTGTTNPVTLSLGDGGQSVTVVVAVEGGISLEPQGEVGLPAIVPPNTNYLSGLEINLSGSNGGGVLSSGGLVFATMDIPEGVTGNLAVMSWNPLLNGGAGGWMEVTGAQINANGQVEFPVFFGGTDPDVLCPLI